MFQRYRQLTHSPGSPLQEPRVLAPFYGPLEGMRDFFTRVRCSSSQMIFDSTAERKVAGGGRQVSRWLSFCP